MHHTAEAKEHCPSKGKSVNTDHLLVRSSCSSGSTCHQDENFAKTQHSGVTLACARRSVKLGGVVLVWLRSLHSREGWQPWKRKIKIPHNRLQRSRRLLQIHP